MVLIFPGSKPATTAPTRPDDINSGLISLGGGSNLQKETPQFIEFPQVYGLSKEELTEMPNVDPLIINAAPTLAQLNDPLSMIKWHSNEKTKFAKRETAEAVTQATIGFVRENNPDLIKLWEEQGERGFREEFTENPLHKIPVAGSIIKSVESLNTIAAMKRLDADNYRDVTTQPLQTMGTGLAGLPALPPQTSTAQQQKSVDMRILGDYLTDQAEMSIRGQSIGGKFGAGISNAPAFMIEWAATGGGSNLIKQAISQSISRKTKSLVGKKVAEGLGKTLGFGGGVVTRAALLPQRIAEASTSRNLQKIDSRITDEGFKILSSESPMKSMLIGGAETLISTFAESSGPGINKGLKALVPTRVKKAFESLFKAKNPNKKASSLWTKGGFDGMISENTEEELEKVMRLGFGIDSFEDYKKNQTFENFLVQASVIGAIGGTGKVAQFVLPKPKVTLAESEEALSGSLDRSVIEPVMAEDGSLDQKSTLDNLPPIPKGDVRLFRAESPTVKFDDVFDREQLKDFAPDRDGSFWSRDLDLADFFRQEYGPDAQLSYVDIPKQDAGNFKVNGGNAEFVLSDSIFKEGNEPLENEVTSETPAKVVPKEDVKQSPIEPKKAEPVQEIPKVAPKVVADKERAPVDPPKRKTRPTEKKAEPIKAKGIARIAEPPIKATTPPRKKRGEPVVKKESKPTAKKKLVFPDKEKKLTPRQQIRKSTGQIDSSKKRTLTEKQILNLKLGSAQKASIKAFTSGGKTSVTNIKDAVSFINQVLPPELRSKAISAATNVNQKDGQRRLFDTLNKIIEKSKTPVKRLIREKTGQTDSSRKTLKGERDLLKLRLASEQRGSLLGSRSTTREAKSFLKQGKDFVNENLPKEARSRAIAALKNSIDQKGFDNLVTTVNNLKDEFEHRKAKEALTKTIKKISGKNANELLPEIRAQIESILDENILTKPSSKTIKDLEGLAQAIEENPFNFNREFINQTLDKVKHAAKTPIGDLPTQTLIDLNDTLNMLIKLNTDKDNMRGLSSSLKFSTVTKGITKSLEKQESLDKEPDSDSEKGILSTKLEITARPKLLVNKIDNSENGFMTQIFHEDVDVAMEQISSDNFEAKQVLIDAAEKAGIKWGSKELQKWSKLESGKTLFGRKVKAKQKTYTFKMNPKEGKKHGIFRTTTRKVKLTPSEIIHLNLVLRDPGNEAKALSDGLIMEGFEKLGKVIHLSLEDVRMIENALTKQEQVFADAIFEYFQTVSKDKLIEIEAQEGRSITLVDKYFPRSVSLAKVQKFGDDLLQVIQKTLSISSFRKERVKNPHPLIIRDVFQVFLEHADQLNKDLYMRPVAKNMLAVLGNPEVSTEITRVYGKGLERNLQERIFDLMTLSNSRFTELDDLYTNFLSKWSVSKLGLRITTILKQVGGLWPAASESSTGIFKHFAKNLVNPKSFERAYQRMIKANATLRDRYTMNSVHLATGIFKDKRMMLGRRGLFDFTMDPMQRMDKAVSVSIFEDFENKIRSANPNMSEAEIQKKAGRSAEIVIADTQNTTSIANMSKLARDSKRSTLLKSVTLFMSNAESMTNLLRTSTWRIKASKLDLSIAKKELTKAQDQKKSTKEIKEEIERLEKKITRDRKQMASTMAAVILGNAGTSVVVNNLNRVAKGGVILLATGAGDDLDKASELKILKLLEELSLEVVGNVHLLGKLTRILNDALQGKPWWQANLLGPLGSTTAGVIQGAMLSVDALKEGLGTPKGKDKSIRAIFKGAEAIATFTGGPVFVVSEIGRPIIKLNSKGSSSGGGGRRRRRRTTTRPGTRRRKRRTRR